MCLYLKKKTAAIKWVISKKAGILTHTCKHNVMIMESGVNLTTTTTLYIHVLEQIKWLNARYYIIQYSWPCLAWKLFSVCISLSAALSAHHSQNVESLLPWISLASGTGYADQESKEKSQINTSQTYHDF